MKHSELLRRVAGGLSYVELAKQLGLDENTTDRVLKGQWPIGGKMYIALLREYPMWTKQILACLREEEVED